jgi:putative ABC transport system permease protein
MSDEGLEELMREMIEAQVRMQMAAQVQAQMANVPAPMLAAQLDAALPNYTTEQCALYYDEILEFSESSLEANLIELGYVDLNSPATVNLYASSFENKDTVEAVIARYNESREELQQVHYTDYVGIMMSSITTIIDAITYILIAFVAISLVVSSIMIGVITLISVQERTKEIGILRAIGASKRNVSSMFNAETMIIGFASGLVGVGLTYLLCLPINAIIQALTGIPNLRAALPIPVAVVLILISMGLTLLSGIIPSRSAARKDPVVALRTE